MEPPETDVVDEPYVRQGEEYQPGTRVYVVGEHAPDAPPAIGTVIGHQPSPPREAERRHLIHMDFGQQPDEWLIDFSLLRQVDDAGIAEVVAIKEKELADYRARQAEHEAEEAAHVDNMRRLEREAEEAELRARIQRAKDDI